MVLVRNPDRGSAPGVLERRVQADRIRRNRQRSTMAQKIHRARKFPQARLECRTPAGPIRGEALCPDGGLGANTSINAAPTIKSAARVGVVEIMDDARHLNTLELIELMLEHRVHARTVVEHQVLSDQAA